MDNAGTEDASGQRRSDADDTGEGPPDWPLREAPGEDRGQAAADTPDAADQDTRRAAEDTPDEPDGAAYLAAPSSAGGAPDPDETTILPVSGGPAPDETTVLPVTARPPVPGETTILPGLGDEPPDDQRAAAGHAAIPGEAEPPSGFLVAQGLSATGPEGAVFTSVSLTAERGEVATIVGNAGTGRTALLLALAGRFKFQAGTLTVAGDARPTRIRQLVAVACAPPAVVFEENHTVAAVLTESALVGDVSEAEVRRRCDDLGLDLDTGEPFGQLPRAEQLLLALASAWATDAAVIAVDDLDSGVDDAACSRLWSAARVIADDQRLVLATAVRAGAASDRCVHPRPLATAHGTHR